MHGIKAFGLLAGHADLLHGHHAQTGALDHGKDLTLQVTGNGIGFDDAKSTFHGISCG